MLRWCRIARLGKSRRGALINDFPRPLSDFEMQKISKQMVEALSATNPAPLVVPQMRPLPSNVEVALASLSTWSTRVAIRALDEIINDASFDTCSMARDERLLSFINRLLSGKLPSSDLLVDFLHVLRKLPMAVSGFERRLVPLLEELILNREMHGLSPQDICAIVSTMTPGSQYTNHLEGPLIEWARAELDPQLLISLLPFGLRHGDMIFPDFLVPALSKRELINLLQPLENCHFPEIIATTVCNVSDHLTRLSFRRLVPEEERNEILKILAKLKVKLDTMVYVEGNPFYMKHKKLNFVGDIVNTLSNDFHHSSTTLPIAMATEKMMALTCLNRLRLDSIDLIVNRISAFGDKLLSPSNVSPSVLSNLFLVMTRHPLSWKRKDKYRALIGHQVSKAFKLHLLAGNMTPDQILSCCESLMTIHNKEIRSVVGQALSRLDIEGPSLISAIMLSSRLLKHQEPTLPVGNVLQFIQQLRLEELKTSQLVHVIEACSHAGIVSRVHELLDKVADRVGSHGGLISPTNVVRLLSAIGELQIRNSCHCIETLTSCIPDPSLLDPKLASRLVSAIAMSSISNPEIYFTVKPAIEKGLLGLSIPDRIQTVIENDRLAGNLGATIKLLGSSGSLFASHLSMLPVGEVNDTVSVADLLAAHIPSSPKVSLEEWKGLLPRETAFIEDILAALVGTPTDYTGGFILESPTVWRNEAIKIEVNVIRRKRCARDDPRHILGATAREVALKRNNGWDVIVLPQEAITSCSSLEPDAVKKRVRRAKIIHGNESSPYSRLVSQLKEILV